MEGGVDRISGLREGILHHILSFLLTEDAIQIVATCKRLNQVWTTLPFLDLGPDFFPILEDFDEDEDEDEDEDKGEGEGEKEENMNGLANNIDTLLEVIRRDKLVNFIEQTLTRRGRMHDLNLHTFKLGQTELDAELRQHLSRWIHYLVEGNVKELVLNVHDQKPYDLPPILLTATSLCALTLTGTLRMPSGAAISLLSLRKLHLLSVFIDDNSLRYIVSNCRELEDLNLSRCHGLQNFVQITGQSQRMRVLDLTLSRRDTIDHVVVEAQYLEKFSWSGAYRPIKLDIITNYNGSLKTIQLANANFTKNWLRELVSKLPRLETLILGLLKLNSIEISSSSLKQLILFRVFESTEKKYGEFTIDTPNLVFLKYDGSLSSVFLTSVAAKRVYLEIYEVNMSFEPEDFSGRLTHFLRKFGDAETVKLEGLFFEHLIFPVEARLNLQAPLAHVKHLIVEGMLYTSPKHVALALVESLLWSCPCLDKLSVIRYKYIEPEFQHMDVSVKVAARIAKHDVMTLSRNHLCHLNRDSNSISPLSHCLCLMELEFEGPDAELFRCLKNNSNYLSFLAENSQLYKLATH